MPSVPNEFIDVIDAIVDRAARLCPGELSLVGIYGSSATGDTHAHSDYDLLILIRDERGRLLTHTFLQDDRTIAHDLYCTTWAMLEQDAAALHPHIAKLMEAKIVWCADETDRARLDALRASAAARLAEPLSPQTIARTRPFLAAAEQYFARAVLADTLADARLAAANVLYELEDAIASLNHHYFRFGTRRALDELDALPRRPADLRAQLTAVPAAKDAASLIPALADLMRAVRTTIAEAEAELPSPAPTADDLRGVYEEIFSNWRGKLCLAAETDDSHLAFLSLALAQTMFDDIPVMTGYDPSDLPAALPAFDHALSALAERYAAANLPICRYSSLSAFLDHYRKDTP